MSEAPDSERIVNDSTHDIRPIGVYLVRVCYQAGHALGSSRAAKHSRPLLKTSLALRFGVEPLQLLVEDPLDSALSDTKVTRAEPLVETTNSFLPGNSLDHIQTRDERFVGCQLHSIRVVRR